MGKLRGRLVGEIDGWIFYYGKRGRERKERKRSPTPRHGIRVRLYGFVAHSCEAVLICVKSRRAKNLNRTHFCRTSVAEPRKPCFTLQHAKIRRGTGTLPLSLFNQSAADLGFSPSPAFSHQNAPVHERARKRIIGRILRSVGGWAFPFSSADFRVFRSRE